MLPPPDPGSLPRLQGEIEAFLRSLEHPVVVENEAPLIDLTAGRWKLSIEFGKLLFEAWNPARSIARRVEGIAYRDRARMGLFVRKPGARETGTLEFRAFDLAKRTERTAGRSRFRQQLVARLEQEFPGWRLERVSTRSDREHSFSARYTRGWMRQGQRAWAFLGLSEEESPAADALLAFGLIWLDWLRSQSERITVAGLRLFLPQAALELTSHRVTCLNRLALQVEIFEWHEGHFQAAKARGCPKGSVRSCASGWVI